MCPSYSSTYTSTYTVSDVEKVVRSIKADLIMIAGSTKAMTEDDAKKYAHDIELLAKNNYITTVDVTLMSSYESEVNAVKYLFQLRMPLVQKDQEAYVAIHSKWANSHYIVTFR